MMHFEGLGLPMARSPLQIVPQTQSSPLRHFTSLNTFFVGKIHILPAHLYIVGMVAHVRTRSLNGVYESLLTIEKLASPGARVMHTRSLQDLRMKCWCIIGSYFAVFPDT